MTDAIPRRDPPARSPGENPRREPKRDGPANGRRQAGGDVAGDAGARQAAIVGATRPFRVAGPGLDLRRGEALTNRNALRGDLLTFCAQRSRHTTTA
jgi:hypothetical protein